jgi:SAM-dependent methyltransferase
MTTAPAKKPGKASSSNSSPSRKPKFTAKTADKHELYQLSVQAPDHELEFIHKTYKKLFRAVPLTLREDFCGTALFCATWVKSHGERRATGVDISKSTLAWGQSRNINPLGEAAGRVELVCDDVRSKRRARYDVINAMNFSYSVFRTREEMRKYFASVKSGLAAQGMFVLDAYGGWESQEPMREPRKVAQGFTYVWDQNKFCPISHEVVNYIHFEFKDGTKLNQAFTYEWRYWTLPELRELLLEAGFSKVDVHWDVAPDDEEEHYKVLTRAENQPGWLAYLVAY